MDENPKKVNGGTGAEPTEGYIVESAPEEPVSQEPELQKLRQQLELKDQEVKEIHDRCLRQAAELENYKKRTTRERDETIRFANEYIIKDLLSVLDNLERAMAHAKGDAGGNSEPFVEGVAMVLRGFLDVLTKHGVVQVNSAEQPFDPQKHEAMAQVESEKHPPNTVVDEYHKGYLLHDRLLRPALVSVAKTPETKNERKAWNKVEKGAGDD
jgi:molecular chaperone GrpE